MSQLEKTIADVRQWFHTKGIIGNSNPLKQLDKTSEELNETRDAVVLLQYMIGATDSGIPIEDELFSKTREDVIDGVGDVVVTLIGVCEMLNLNIEDCLQTAYDEIKGRTGTVVNGVFIKNK
jgi:hypothetical protein